MRITHLKGRISSAVGWYIGRLQLLTGMITLGAASAIISISNKGNRKDLNQALSLKIVPLMLAAFTLFSLGDRRRERRTEPT